MTRHAPGPADHIERLIALRRAQTPDVPLDGMAILGRAKRLTVLSRPAIEAVFAGYGIDTGEFDILATLRRSGPPFELRPTELMHDLLVSSGGLTDQLGRLERKGLIERKKSGKDGRSSLAKLTRAGLVLADQAYAEDMAVEERMLRPLDGAERRELSRLLAKLLAYLEMLESG